MHRADPFSPAPSPSNSPTSLLRIYTLLIVDEDMASPSAILLEAEDDGDAVALARSHHPSKRRELWQRHRLVAEFD